MRSAYAAAVRCFPSKCDGVRAPGAGAARRDGPPPRDPRPRHASGPRLRQFRSIRTPGQPGRFSRKTFFARRTTVSIRKHFGGFFLVFFSSEIIVVFGRARRSRHAATAVAEHAPLDETPVMCAGGRVSDVS